MRPLPAVKTWDFFYVFGMSGSVGLSKTIGGGKALSFGTGFDILEPRPATDSTPATPRQILPKAALYFDRNGSLMWSILLGNRTAANRLTVNMYPGVFRIHGFTTGAWMQLPKNGGLRAGLVSKWGVGLSGASSSARP